jgi:glycolate oxidase
MLSPSIKSELKRIVGKENFSSLSEDLLCYSFDATNNPSKADAVIFPSTAEEISLILKMANAEDFSVVPRGAGTGFTGGAVPIEGGLLLSTERMKDINIDEENLLATVGAGAITGDIQDMADALGLFYPPDPTSAKFSTIGGNIAECAGGPRAVKYGTTRDYVLGLEVVLPTGEIIVTGVKTLKGVVGYDLTRLVTGSEGTLAIITRAYLRLIPAPMARRTMYAAFAELTEAALAVSSIIGSRIVPSTLELIDESSLKCVEEQGVLKFPELGGILLIEVDGDEGSVDEKAARIKDICVECNSVEFRVAEDKWEVKDLWKVRKAISPALYRIRPKKINEDIVVPRSKMVELIRGVKDISTERDVVIACFGHAGDGNIHVNIMIDGDDAKERERGEEATKDLFKLTLSLGGTISGEHGIGTSKAPYLEMELDRNSIELMKRLKDSFDPKGILNPGKIFIDKE